MVLPCGAVIGTIFDDRDGDGEFTAADRGFGGIQVSLRRNLDADPDFETAVLTVFTNVAGGYRFDNRTVRDYAVVVDGPGLPSNAVLTAGSTESFALRRDEQPFREIYVPAGARLLRVEMTGGGDADLVLRYLEPPDRSQFFTQAFGPELFIPFQLGSEESIAIQDPLPGVYVLSVVALLDQVVDVTVTLE